MSLFVRVFNNFYTHRKTARLKAVIGEAAYWVPPRLWAYAAENQPDGCFKEYSPEEIAMLIGYLGDAKVMLEAMLRASFMDDKPLRIHDWADYNDYHAKYSARASKASKARWEKERRRQETERIGEDRRGEEASIAQASVKECLEHETGSYHKDSRAVLHILNEACGKRFRETDTNLGLISQRLKEPGVDLGGVKIMISRQCKRWLKTRDAEYLQPSTLFGKEKFDNYYAARDQPIYENDSRNNGNRVDRNKGTFNEGTAGQYDLSKIQAKREIPDVSGAGTGTPP